MGNIHAIILGFIQGLTEFLPVSSSGHLVLVEHLLHLEIDPVLLQGFDVLLHAGTALAIFIVYFSTWKQILLSIMTPKSPGFRHAWFLVLATVPAAITGVLWQDAIAEFFRTPRSVAIGFALTAVLLTIRSRQTTTTEPTQIRWWQIVAMGLIQALAIIPGVSRSGSTIAIGKQTGFSTKLALDISFQMALPIIAGAVLLTLVDAAKGEVYMPSFSICIIGFLSSFIVSLVTLLWLRRFINRYDLSIFALYLIPLAVFASFL